MSLNLYQITSAFPTLMEQESLSEEEKDIVKNELNTLLANKSRNIIAYIRNEELTVEAMKLEEKRISEQRKTRESRITKFKEYVKDCMENSGLLKIETELGNLSIAKSPISVEIVNENKIPNEFKEEIITTKIDKKKIADNFKSTGELIDGVIIHTDNTNLRIK